MNVKQVFGMIYGLARIGWQSSFQDNLDCKMIRLPQLLVWDGLSGMRNFKWRTPLRDSEINLFNACLV